MGNVTENTQGRLEKVKTDRGRDWETKINDNVI